MAPRDLPRLTPVIVSYGWLLHQNAPREPYSICLSEWVQPRLLLLLEFQYYLKTSLRRLCPAHPHEKTWSSKKTKQKPSNHSGGRERHGNTLFHSGCKAPAVKFRSHLKCPPLQGWLFKRLNQARVIITASRLKPWLANCQLHPYKHMAPAF